MKVRDLILELREMDPEAEVRSIDNGGECWRIKTDAETVLIRTGAGSDEGWRRAIESPS
jgi:hypothetical protein